MLECRQEGGILVITAISYFIAIMSIVVLLTFWFLNTYSLLSRKKEDMLQAEVQVRFHREECQQMRGKPDEKAAQRMLETSFQIYLLIEKSYNETLWKPIYHVPGILMGFRIAERLNIDNNTKEEQAT